MNIKKSISKLLIINSLLLHQATVQSMEKLSVSNCAIDKRVVSSSKDKNKVVSSSKDGNRMDKIFSTCCKELTQGMEKDALDYVGKCMGCKEVFCSYSGNSDQRLMDGLNLQNDQVVKTDWYEGMFADDVEPGVKISVGSLPGWFIWSKYKALNLKNFAVLTARPCDGLGSSPTGVCRNWACKIWKDFNSNGFYGGLMFLRLGGPRVEMCPGLPDHVVFIYAVVNNEGIAEYYIADPRSLQSACSFSMPHKLKKHFLKKCLIDWGCDEVWREGINIMRESPWSMPNCKLDNYMDFFKIPLDKYLEWYAEYCVKMGINDQDNPISIAADPNDLVSNPAFSKNNRIGPKTITQFKEEVEKRLKKTV